MRILHVYRTFYPETQGGLEEVIRQICLNTKSANIECRVFTLANNPDNNPVELPEGLVIQEKRHLDIASCSISFSALSSFKEQVEWADIVHYHFPWPFGDLLHLMSRHDKPSVVTYHSDIVRQKFLNLAYYPLMKLFLSRADTVICTSPNYFATSSTLTSIANKVEVIPIGLTPPRCMEQAPDADNGLVIEDDKPYFVFVGVLRYYKGLHILLDAMVNAPYRVIIVGSGPIETELRQQAQALRLNNVTFAGYINDAEKFQLLRKAMGVVFPSYLRSEAFGVTLLEGAMMGLPLISTEVGSGTSHVNIDGETGIVVTPSSAPALRQAMDKLYEQPELAARYGCNARARYEALFTGELMGQRYAELYRGVMLKQTDARQVAAFPVDS
ncbi:MAG: glycosyltransferase [Pseudomonadota bacterium]